MCNRGCNTGSGSCSGSGNRVVKFTCEGRSAECRQNESAFAQSYSLAGTTCGQTVQIDVFNKNCRPAGTWVCNDADLQDYFVWYSGDCQSPSPTTTPMPTSSVKPTTTPTHTPPTPTSSPKPTRTPTPTAQTHLSSCDQLSVISGNDGLVPANVTFRVRGSDNLGNPTGYRIFFGDGQQSENSNPEISHRYETSGNFLVRADIKDSKGVYRSSSQCETRVTVKPLPIESHKSDCADLFITNGNQQPAPATGGFIISGYDNKGPIKKYRLDFGDGQTLEGDTAKFEKLYKTPGTYTIRGYIQDSTNNWKGGTGNCQKTLYVQTKPLTSQPKTGTPTWFTFFGLGSGLASLLVWKRIFG